MCNRFANAALLTEILALVRRMKCEPAFSGTVSCPAGEMFPDRDVPVLRSAGMGRLKYDCLRWGLPPPPGLKAPITNIRHLDRRWWRVDNREWILPAPYRCLVPFTAFAEPARHPTWFAAEGLACFAGIWQPWRGERLAGSGRRVRKLANWELFAFLTTEANADVRPFHPQAMPVILTAPEEMTAWLAGGETSFRLQRPLSNGLLRINPVPKNSEPAQKSLLL